jgi:hypothetical protein
MIEGLAVRIKAMTMSATPFHRMRVADMSVLARLLVTVTALHGSGITAMSALNYFLSRGYNKARTVRYQGCFIPSVHRTSSPIIIS